MVITKEMAISSLRPNLNAWVTHGTLSTQDIDREKNRLKTLSESDLKKIRRTAHHVDPGELYEMIEDLTTRIAALERKPK